jgi:hypothetical protein
VFVTQTIEFNAINPNQIFHQFAELQDMVDDSVKQMANGRGRLYTVKAAHPDRFENRLSKARAASTEHEKRVSRIAERLELGGTIESFSEEWDDEEIYQDNDDSAILKEYQAEESKKEQAVAMADRLTDDELDEDAVKEGPDEELPGDIHNVEVEEESCDEDEGMVSAISGYFGKTQATKRHREDDEAQDEAHDDTMTPAKRRRTR